MVVFVLLFRDGDGNEGIHTLSIGQHNTVLMFEEEDDATRYALLLEAQDFMTPTVEGIDRAEIEAFCDEAQYDCKLVPKGFIPETEADRLMIAPPETNLEQTHWEGDSQAVGDARAGGDPSPEAPASEDGPGFSGGELDDIRRRLEGLL